MKLKNSILIPCLLFIQSQCIAMEQPFKKRKHTVEPKPLQFTHSMEQLHKEIKQLVETEPLQRPTLLTELPTERLKPEVELLKIFAQRYDISAPREGAHRHPLLILYQTTRNDPIEHPRMARRRYLDFLIIFRTLFPDDVMAQISDHTQYLFNAGNIQNPYSPGMLKIAQPCSKKKFSFYPTIGRMLKETENAHYSKGLANYDQRKFSWHSVPFRGFGNYAIEDQSEDDQ